MINGKAEERLCGDGPNLRIVLRQDDYLVKLRKYIIQFFKKNFEAAVVYIQRFQSVRQFLAENEEKSHESIANETGTVQICKKKCIFVCCITERQVTFIYSQTLFCVVHVYVYAEEFYGILLLNSANLTYIHIFELLHYYIVLLYKAPLIME
jgi:hypothetical protein